ncbi:MAG: hypothetical protein QXQ18_02575 [Candidatus Aenigmatarchaeota archaeon]
MFKICDEYKKFCKELHKAGIKLDPNSSEKIRERLNNNVNVWNKLNIILENVIPHANFIYKAYLSTFSDGTGRIKIDKIPNPIAILYIDIENYKYELKYNELIEERLRKFGILKQF